MQIHNNNSTLNSVATRRDVSRHPVGLSARLEKAFKAFQNSEGDATPAARPRAQSVFQRADDAQTFMTCHAEPDIIGGPLAIVHAQLKADNKQRSAHVASLRETRDMLRARHAERERETARTIDPEQSNLPSSAETAENQAAIRQDIQVLDSQIQACSAALEASSIQIATEDNLADNTEDAEIIQTLLCTVSQLESEILSAEQAQSKQQWDLQQTANNLAAKVQGYQIAEQGHAQKATEYEEKTAHYHTATQSHQRNTQKIKEEIQDLNQREKSLLHDAKQKEQEITQGFATQTKKLQEIKETKSTRFASASAACQQSCEAQNAAALNQQTHNQNRRLTTAQAHRANWQSSLAATQQAHVNHLNGIVVEAQQKISANRYGLSHNGHYLYSPVWKKLIFDNDNRKRAMLYKDWPQNNGLWQIEQCPEYESRLGQNVVRLKCTNDNFYLGVATSPRHNIQTVQTFSSPHVGDRNLGTLWQLVPAGEDQQFKIRSCASGLWLHERASRQDDPPAQSLSDYNRWSFLDECISSGRYALYASDQPDVFKITRSRR